MNINVVKRNGEIVPLDIAKIQRQVAYDCKGIDNVSPSMIEIKAQIELHDGISTETIDELLLKAMVNLNLFSARFVQNLKIKQKNDNTNTN